MIELPTDIDKIANMADPVLRNLLITQRYHDLSLALSETIGDGGVNWSTFATWASKTAGQSIRNEELPSFVKPLLVDSTDDVMHPLGKIETAIHAVVPTTGFHASFLLAPITETVGAVSSSIGRGNRKVFAELAPQFVRFVEAFRGAGTPSNAAIAGWVESLDPRPTTVDAGQRNLQTAFTAYAQAIRTTDPVEKARLVLLGNCLIGLHEQTRLQPEIQEAMDAPIDTILRNHLHGSLGAGAGKGRLAELVAVIERPFQALVDVVQDLWERVATRLLMSLALPGGASIPLGRNIPKDAAAQAFLPVPLQNITAPTDLVDLLTTYDRARGVTSLGSASVDWRILEDRMNFIVNLFRSRQIDATLFSQPFADEQRTAIEAGLIPPITTGL